MRTTIVTVAGLCLMLIPIACTTDMAGGSTESTNQRIANTVYEPDGVTPAEGAMVIIRSQNTLAVIAGITSEQQNVTSDTVITDDSGRYTFDNPLSDGLYSFEAIKDGNAVFVNPVNVADGDKAPEIDPVTIKPTGRITGAIRLAEGGDPTQAYVLALGIDRFTRVRDDGTFAFDKLGEGEYCLKIITTISTYGAFDTAWITVSAAETTEIGMIKLPFSGIPVPRNVNVTYDPDLQQATITWDKVQRPGVMHYNIYRGHKTFADLTGPIDANVRLNGYRVTDTVFIDSTIGGLGPNGLPAAVAYRVSVVDSSENEGEKSVAAEVNTPPSVTIAGDVNLRSWTNGRIRDFATAHNGDIYVACDAAPFIFILDSVFNYKGEFWKAGLSDADSSSLASSVPTGICINGTAELLYIARSGTTGMFVYNYEGALIDTIEDSTVQARGVVDCEVIGNSLYVLAGGDSVIGFDVDGNRKTAWPVAGGRCLADGGAARVAVGAYKQIYRYDSVGNLLSIMHVPAPPLSIAVDTVKQHFYTLTGSGPSFTLKEYDSANCRISQYVHPLLGIGSSKQAVRLQQDGCPLVLHSESLIGLSASDN